MSDGKTFVQHPVVAEYYRSGFLLELVERHGLKKKEEPANNAATFAAYYGVKALPAELEKFLLMRDEYEFVHHRLAEWRIFGEDVWLPDPAKGNLAEQVIALDQRNYLGTCILEYSAGCIFLGTAGNGDAYLAYADPEGNSAEVVFWDHETNDLEFSIADSLSSLAYANHLLAKVQDSEEDEEEASLGNIAEAFGCIKDRVNLSWHYRSLEEVAEAEGGFKGASPVRYFFYRTLWINYLLRNDRVHTMRAVSEVFGIVDHGQLNVDKAIESPWLAVLPQTAFYWLWRLFFFNKDEKLRRVIEIAKAGGNPFVRDLALLVEELQNGRKKLGSIEDIHALREAFLALDLDPDRAEEREREQKEAERLAEEQKAADEKRAAKMLATRNDGELVDLAWEDVGNEVIVTPIYNRLRVSEPALAADFVRADFYFNQGYSRNNCIYSDERDDVLEALGRAGNARLAPLLLNQGGHNLLPTVARMGDGRVLASITRMLDERSEYNHGLVCAVQAAGALRAKSLAEKLIAMIGEFSYAADDFHSRIKNKELLWALFEALAEIGDPRAVEPMARIAASNHKDLTARAMASLGRLGDPGAVDVLLPALSGLYMRPAMFALARIGDISALEPMTALVEKRRGLAERLVYDRVMLDALRSRCGQTFALDNARFALKCVEGNKYEDVELHETAIDLLARHLVGDALRGLLAPFVDAEHGAVRHAARMALGTGGKPAPVNFYDRATVDAMFAARGVEGLRAALCDGQGALRHNVVRKAIDEKLGAELEAELIAYGRELLTYEHGTCGYSDGWKRKMDALGLVASLGGEAADRLAYDAMTHPNYMMRRPFEYHSDAVKERVRRFGPLEPRQPEPAAAKARQLEVERLGQARWSLGGMVNGVAFTPDGERLIATGGQGGAGGAAIVFDRNGDEIRPLPEVRGWAYDVDIHRDGGMAAFGLHAGHLLLIDIESGELLADLRGHGGVPDGVRKVRFSPDGTLLASASDDESVIIWDVASRTALRRVHDKFDVNTVDWFPDGRRVVFGTDKQVGIIDVADENAEIRRIDIGGVAEVRVFANGTRIAAGGSTKKGIVILNETLEILRTFDQRNVARIRFSEDESQMFAVSWEGERLAMRWDMASGEATHLAGHDDASLFALDLDPQTGAPFAGGKRNVVASWDADGALREAGSAGHGGEVAQIVRCGDDEVISVAEDGSVIRWSLATREALTRYRAAEPMRARAVALSPGRAIVVATGFDGAVAFRVSNGVELWRQNGLKRSEIAVGLPDHFVVGSDRELVWLDAKTGEIVHRQRVDDGSWLEHLLPVPDRSPVSSRLAFVAAYRTPRLRLFDLAARRCLESVELPVRADKAETYGIGAGGGKLVVSRWDKSFDVLDAGALQHRFQAHELYSYAPVAVSPDGGLVACGEDVLRLFDAETFELAARQSLGHKISALAFVGPRHVVAGLANGQLVSVKISENSAHEPALLGAQEVYSDEGLLLEKNTDFEDGDFSEKRTYAYDSEGRVIEDRHQCSSLCFLYKYAYAPEKQEILKATYRKDGSLKDSVEREYDGETLVSVVYKGKGGALQSKGAKNGEEMSYEFFHSSGVKAASGSVKAKMAVGVWRFYDETGHLTHQLDLSPFELRCRIDEDFRPGSVLGDALVAQIDMGAPLPPQLAGVDDIEWSSVRGGYRGAENFPRLLRALASPEKAARNAAFGDIYTDAFFHNSVWDSAAYAMPFLIRLLEHPNADHAEIMEFIHELAEAAAPYVEEAEEARRQSSDDGEDEGDGDAWWFSILGVMEGVAEGWPILQKFTEAEDSDIRKLAMSLAQYANSRHDTKTALLEIARNHHSAEERAVAVNGVLSLPDASPQDAIEFLRDEELLVRTAAALVTAPKWGPESPPQVVDVLKQAFAEQHDLHERYAALPIARSDIRTEIALSLGCVRNDAALAFLPILCDQLDNIPTIHAWDYGRGLLALALGRGRLPFAKDFPAALDAIARCKEFFTWVNGSEVLRDWALPTSAPELLKLAEDTRNADNPEQAMHDWMHRPQPVVATCARNA